MTKYYLRFKSNGKYTFVPQSFTNKKTALMYAQWNSRDERTVEVSTTKYGTAIGYCSVLTNGPAYLGSMRKTMSAYVTPTKVYQIDDKGNLTPYGENKMGKQQWKMMFTPPSPKRPKPKRKDSEDIFAWYTEPSVKRYPPKIR